MVGIRQLGLVVFLGLISVACVSATNFEMNETISFNITSLAHTEVFGLNITGTINDTLNVSYGKVINLTDYYNDTDFSTNKYTSLSWLTQIPQDINLTNVSSFLQNFSFTIPTTVNGHETNYQQSFNISYGNGSTNQVYVYFFLDTNETTTTDSNATNDYDYTGSCTYFDTASTLEVDINIDEDDLSYTKEDCFAFGSDTGTYYTLVYEDDYMNVDTTIFDFASTNIIEFDVTIGIGGSYQIEGISDSLDQGIIITGSNFSKIITYDITLSNSSYAYAEDIDLTTLDNDTIEYIIDYMDEYREWYNNNSPEVIVENETIYQSIPVSPELFQKWIEEFNPDEVKEMKDLIQLREDEIASLEKKYEDERNDHELAKRLRSDQESLNSQLKEQNLQDIASTESEYEAKIQGYKDRAFFWLKIIGGILTVGLIGMLFIFRARNISAGEF